MATNAIIVEWGTPFAGRERMGLEEFGSFTQWATGLKAQNKLERFEVYAPSYGSQQKLAGFAILEGSEQQIDAIAKSDEFRIRVDRGLTLCHNVRVDRCDVGTSVAQRMKLYGTAIQQLKL